MNASIADPAAARDAGPARGSAVLQVGPFLPPLKDALLARYGATRLPEQAQASFLRTRGPEFTVAVTSGKVGVSSDLIRALPNLRAIVSFGVGYDRTDIDLARERGILVSNTPDVLNDCVADTAVALFLDVFRRVTAADRFVRNGDWARGSFPLATKASGKRVGIVGLGRIGTVIARRLEAFDSIISYHNRKPVPGVPYRYAESVLSLATDSDALIVAAAGGPGSARLVSADVLKALGPGGYLINIARGSLVDQDALITALTEGTIAGAGLDVFANEPHVPAALLGLDNVVVLPHLASGTNETRRAMTDLVLANLERFMSDGTLVTPIP
jgi:lactate dehydrogenase-like 2-hydroxyacid dehydrogenase